MTESYFSPLQIKFGILYSAFQHKLWNIYIQKKGNFVKKPFLTQAQPCQNYMYTLPQCSKTLHLPVVKQKVNRDKSVIFMHIIVVFNEFRINIYIKLVEQSFHFDLYANYYGNVKAKVTYQHGFDSVVMMMHFQCEDALLGSLFFIKIMLYCIIYHVNVVTSKK